MLDQFFEQLQQAVRRFIENAGALFLGDGRQALLPLAPFGRQKTFKAKAPLGKPLLTRAVVAAQGRECKSPVSCGAGAATSSSPGSLMPGRPASLIGQGFAIG